MARVNTSNATDEQVTTALLVLITYKGNVGAARQALKVEHGLDIHPNTLAAWKGSTYKGEYDVLAADHSDTLEKELVDRVLENAGLALDAEKVALEKAKDMLESDDGHPDPARAARDLSNVKAQAVDKARLMQDKPTEIADARTIEETLKALVAGGVLVPTRAAAPAGRDA